MLMSWIGSNWRVIGASVTGSKHASCQDAYGWSNRVTPMLVLSDGHGGQAHDLSGIGAKLCVNSAIRTMESFLEAFDPLQPLMTLIKALETQWVYAFWLEWSRVVMRYEACELSRYGCTFLMVIQWQNAFIFLQCGDGRCVSVNENGDVFFPFSDDVELRGNATYSMADQNAWIQTKIAYILADQALAMVGLFTDGVQNAYPYHRHDDAAFYCALTDDEAYLKKGLMQASTYSKDDASGICFVKAGWQGVIKNHVYQGIDKENAIRKATQGSYDQRLENALELARQNASPELIETLLTLQPAQGLVPLGENAFKYLQALQAQHRFCEYCGIEHEAACSCTKVMLHSPAGSFQLSHKARLYLHHFMPLCGTYDPVVGHIIQHPKHPSVWGVAMTDRVIPIKHGQRLKAYGLHAIVSIQ